jgi:branched-chain amino acid transport system substrate-binding protein
MQNTRRLPPIAYLLFAIVVAWGVNQLWQSITHFGQTTLTDRRSSGERLLITEIDSSEKRSGIQSFANGDFNSAIEHFQASLKESRNDVETRLYLQNSIAIQKVGDPKKLVKIAVFVPIGSNVNIAQEMLRGISQVQMEINQRGGINGIPISIEIFNDDNNPRIAQELAKQAIQDPQLRAVFGSNTSDASLASAPIFQRGGLVMISPTSMTRDLSGIGNYIFRTTPTSQSLTSTLAQQIYTVDRHRKLAICFDGQASDSVSFKEELIAEFARLGGSIANFTCDVGATNFNPNDAIVKAGNNGADAIFVASHIDRLPLAIQVATANQGKLPLYSSPTLNTFQTLQAGYVVSGLQLVTPWQNPLEPQSGSFADRSQRLWGGQVSWRTAMSFDAGMAIVAGLRQSNGTRQGLMAALHQPQFSAEGASGKVTFLPTGDRVLTPTIAQVREVNGKWVFTPLPSPTTVGGTFPTENRLPQFGQSLSAPFPQK